MKIDINVQGNKVSGSVSHDGEYPLPLKGAEESVVLEKLKAATNYNVGLLPPAVRWISKDKSIVVFERPPTKQRVDIIPFIRDQITEHMNFDAYICTYELNIPWTVYVCAMDKTYLPLSVRVFVRSTPITSMSDTLGLLPLLNFYTTSKLCNPTGTREFEGLPESLGEGLNIAYNTVWNSGWNYDLRDAIVQSMRRGFPFNQKEQQAVRLLKLSENEYNACGRNPDIKNILYWHKLWESKSMKKMLAAGWAVPAAHAKIGAEKRLTLSQAVDAAYSELNYDGISQSRTFLVNVASALM